MYILVHNSDLKVCPLQRFFLCSLLEVVLCTVYKVYVQREGVLLTSARTLRNSRVSKWSRVCM